MKRGQHPNSLANLKSFKPGESGNPGGRPKKHPTPSPTQNMARSKRPITDALLRLLSDPQRAEEFAAAVVNKIAPKMSRAKAAKAAEFAERIRLFAQRKKS